MDVDIVQPTRNSPFINFFDISTNFPWQEPRPEQIRQRRVLMNDGLLFDVLLMSGGVDEPYLYYPPEDPQSLQTLLDVIESSTYDTLKKDCLVYFLLKWHQDGRERNFQQQRCIPPQFAALADAFWHLDTGINTARAVAILSDARLNRDYASKIIHAISISPDPGPLIRRYVQTAKPLLVEPLDIECYALALADSSILEAWQFSRTFNEADSMRGRLLKKIVEWTVAPNPRPIALSQLITLPLSTFEEDVFNDFVQKPPSSLKFAAVATLQDLICVRLIQGGRYNEAIKLDQKFTSTTLPKNVHLTKARSKMVHDIYSALPSIERSLIDLALDPNVVPKAPLTPKPPTSMRRQAPPPEEPGDISLLSQSWEDVRIDLQTSQATPLREVRVPAATPRFSGTPGGAPILPINFNGIASTSKATPRKSLPLSSLPLTSSVARARPSLSGVGHRMAAFAGSPVVSSPASGLRVQAIPTPTFTPAGQQPNAFYKPPPQKTNGVKRAFEDDLNHRSDHTNVPAQDEDVDMEQNGDDVFNGDKRKDGEKEKEKKAKPNGRRRGRISAATEEPEEEQEEDNNVLQYSVFTSSKEVEALEVPSSSVPKPKRIARKKEKAPPGAFVSEDDDAMDEDHDGHKTRSSRVRKSSSRGAEAQESLSKPPAAKKARQTKDVSRPIPGGFGDEQDELQDEEMDHVAPLPSPPRRGARKLRASVSVDSAVDDADGVKTRRRSSRLSTHGSVGGGSPEPPAPPAPKTRRTAARTMKKKKN